MTKLVLKYNLKPRTFIFKKEAKDILSSEVNFIFNKEMKVMKWPLLEYSKYLEDYYNTPYNTEKRRLLRMMVLPYLIKEEILNGNAKKDDYDLSLFRQKVIVFNSFNKITKIKMKNAKEAKLKQKDMLLLQSNKFTNIDFIK
jgi:hypothetical protein